MESKNLSVSIKCECNHCHEWMAFAAWYSFRKRAPECKVFLELNLSKPIFRWANRLGVKISRRVDADFVIPPTIILARDFDGNLEIASSKSNIQNSLVDYSFGCGNFVVDEWINKSKVPFYKALRRFGTNNLTVNEMAILTFWEQCHHVYLSAGGA